LTWLGSGPSDRIVVVVAILASVQVVLELELPPDDVFAAVPVVRVIVCPLTDISEVADTTVVPSTAEVIVTVQDAVAVPPV